MELRLIRFSVSKTLRDYEDRLKSVDPDSDESIELGNDTVILANILEKISEKEGV